MLSDPIPCEDAGDPLETVNVILGRKKCVSFFGWDAVCCLWVIVGKCVDD